MIRNVVTVHNKLGMLETFCLSIKAIAVKATGKVVNDHIGS